MIVRDRRLPSCSTCSYLKTLANSTCEQQHDGHTRDEWYSSQVGVKCDAVYICITSEQSPLEHTLGYARERVRLLRRAVNLSHPGSSSHCCTVPISGLRQKNRRTMPRASLQFDQSAAGSSAAWKIRDRESAPAARVGEARQRCWRGWHRGSCDGGRWTGLHSSTAYI